MNEGRIASWKVAEGASFSSGDVLCEVETDKASMDYEAPVSGVLLKILLPAGATAKVGEPIAIVGKEGEDISSLPAAPSVSVEPPSSVRLPPEQKEKTASEQFFSISAEADKPHGAPAAPARMPPSTPLARLRARERGIDLRLVRGSGPNGRIIERDVFEWVPSNGAAKVSEPAASIEPPSRMRAIIARRLSDSFFSAPHFYLKKKIKAQPLLDLRAFANQNRAEKLSFNAFLVKMAAMALVRHPAINVFWKQEGIERRTAVDIGLAVALDDGLITPVVRQCDRKTVGEIDKELRALIVKAQSGTLTPEEYEGAGFTITNLGTWGVDEFTAIINPPASAILAVGAVVKEPIAGDNDRIEIAPMLTLVLGCDHRSIDGATGAAFLADLAYLLEHPAAALI